MNAIRVLLADDHPLLRAGIRSLLEGLENISIVGEAGDGDEAMRLIELHRPDVVIMDIAMPRQNGLEVAERVAERFPETRVIILSMYNDEEYVRRAMQVGASGYLLKESGAQELELAVRAVARGETFLCQAVSSQVMSGYLRYSTGQTSRNDPLTQRQRQVLELIAAGLTTKAIARRLNIGVKTVETHRSQLMDRLNIHDIAGLVRYAIRQGLIRTDTP